MYVCSTADMPMQALCTYVRKPYVHMYVHTYVCTYTVIVDSMWPFGEEFVLIVSFFTVLLIQNQL